MATPPEKDLEKARKSLKEFEKACGEAKKCTTHLGLTEFGAKMDSMLGEAKFRAADVHFAEARRLSSTDPGEAKKLAHEAAKILRGPSVPAPVIEKAREALIKSIAAFIEKGIIEEVPAAPGEGKPPGLVTAPSAVKPDEIASSVDRLISEEKYAEARKAAAELLKLAKEKGDADLERKAAELVERIRKEQFRELDAEIDAWTDQSRIPTDKEKDAIVEEAMESTDIIGAVREEVRKRSEKIKREVSLFLGKAKQDDIELAAVRKRLSDHLASMSSEAYDNMKRIPRDIRANVYEKCLPPTNKEELKVFFWVTLDKDLQNVNKFINEWR
jgi:hypothetical protein